MLGDIGIHVFEQNGPIKWEKEIIGINLASILTWNYFHGPIYLFCNKEYLQTLKKWGIDKLYQHIDTDLLESKPSTIDYTQYYAFSKLWVIKHLDIETPFTILDNDLWLLDKLVFEGDSKVIMYHQESFSKDYHLNVYPDFNQLITDDIKELELNDKVLPTNTALLHIKDSSFVDEWYSLSEKIAIFNQNKVYDFKNNSVKMCFVEQRLLPMILEKNSINYKTFIDHIYLTHQAEKQDGSEWDPDLRKSNNEQLEKFSNIKHVWGLKKYFHLEQIRNLIMSSCIDVLKHFEPESEIVRKFLESYSDNQVLADSNR